MSKNELFAESINRQLDESILKSQDYLEFCKHYAALAAEMGNAKKMTSKTDLSDEEVALQDEISKLYIEKVNNNQQLIDINEKILGIEEKISILDERMKKMKGNYQAQCGIYAKLEVEYQRNKSDHMDNKDEHLAFNTNVTLLRAQITKLEEERIQFMNKIRQLNEDRGEILKDEAQLKERKASLKVKEASLKPLPKETEITTLLQEKTPVQDTFMFDAVPMSMFFSFKTDDGEVNDVKWISENMFVTGGSDRKVKIWRSSARDEPMKVCSLDGSTSSITQIDYDAQRRNILASSNDRNVLLFNVDSQRLVTTFSGHSDSVTCTKFYSTSGAISGSADRIIKIWDLPNQRCTRSFYPISKILDIETKFATSPVIFASAHHDKNVRIWDGRSSDAAKTINLGGRVTSLCMSKNGQEMLCSTRDDTLTLIDIRTFGIVHMYSSENYHTSSDYSRCVMSPGGDFIAAGSSNGCLFIWNKTTTRLEKRLKSDTENTILSVAWNPTGQGILAAFRQKNVVCWK